MAREQLILDRYRPLEQAGAGASGVVQVAWDTVIQRRVAIKRVPLQGSADMAAETLAEARTAAMLSHPNIVTVLDFEIAGSDALIIMEHVDGCTLGDILDARDGEPLDLDVTASIVHAVAEALSYAHENGVLHLDVKPENVLISHDGQVKVSDFGMASLAGAQGFTAARGGTIGYMPPEQMEGRPCDARTDEWALASMANEMLTGTNPFFARDLRRAYHAACHADVVVPSAVRDDVSPTIDGIILDALSPSPEVRFGSVASFENAIAPFLGSRRRGRQTLKRLVNNPAGIDATGSAKASGDDATTALARTDDAQPGGFDLWERMPPAAARWATAVAAAAGSAWVSWLGFSYAQVEGTTLAILTLVVAGVALAVPHLGAVLAFIALGAGLALAGCLVPGIAIAALGLAWWLAAGRHDDAQAALVMCAPLTGIAHIGSLLPLASGFFLTTGRAIVATAVGIALDIACAGATGAAGAGAATGATALHVMGTHALAYEPTMGFRLLATDPQLWIVACGWVLGAATMAALCSRGRRAGGIAGAVLASGLELLLQLSAQRVAAGGIWTPAQAPAAISLLMSLILTVTICSLGAPPRARRGGT